MDIFSTMQESCKLTKYFLIVLIISGILIGLGFSKPADPSEVPPGAEPLGGGGPSGSSTISGSSGSSASDDEGLEASMRGLCSSARSLLALGAMLLVVAAAAVYAIGQIVGAETRARASVWATAMLTGAVIGIIIYLIVPGLIATMMGGNLTNPDNPCEGITTS